MPGRIQNLNHRQLRIACFLLAGIIAAVAYGFDGLSGIWTTGGFMFMNEMLLTVLYRVTEGVWPLGRSRFLDLYNHILGSIFLFAVVPGMVMEILPAPYVATVTGAVYILAFTGQWLFPPHWTPLPGTQGGD